MFTHWESTLNHKYSMSNWQNTKYITTYSELKYIYRKWII